jgi:thiol-disulfide isomerase/thioredoxin
MSTNFLLFRIESMLKSIFKSALIFIIVSLLSLGVNAQAVEVIKVSKLESLISESTGKVQIFNFWATWCGPCVKEIPFFEATAQTMQEKINVNLISIDFVEELLKVEKFIERKEITSKVYLLDDVDYNSWIDKVDPSWSGAIPATLIVNPATGKRKFIEHELQEGELEKLINELLK